MTNTWAPKMNWVQQCVFYQTSTFAAPPPTLPAGETVLGSSLAAESAKSSGNFMNLGGQMKTKTLMASQSGRASRP